MTYEHVRDDIHRAVKQTLLMLDAIEMARYQAMKNYNDIEDHLERADRFLESVHANIQTALHTIKRDKESRDVNKERDL